MKHNIRVLIIVLLVTTLLSSALFVYYDYAKEEVRIYQNEILFYQTIASHEQAWIKDIQLENGALPFRKLSNGTATIIPYFSAISGMALLQDIDTDYSNQVIHYIEWMLENLNDSSTDYFNIDGTMSNFKVNYLDDNSYQLIPYKYDSVDSYTALMISLIMRTYERTNDIDFLLKHESKIIRILNALLSTRLDNGLSSVSVGNRTQYIMDNVEVNYGLKDGIKLVNRLLEVSNETIELNLLKVNLDGWLDDNTNAIEELLWNNDKGTYNVALNESNLIVEFKSWDNFYPDAVAQLFPIIFEVIEPGSNRAKTLYNEFNINYQWEDFIYRETGDFYWTVIVYVAALMEDESRVKAYLSYYQENFMDTHPYPLYNAEAAWIVNASKKMMEYYQAKIDRIDPFSIFH
jgi:hypothetical protein